MKQKNPRVHGAGEPTTQITNNLFSIASIQIPNCGDLQLEDVAEFSKAIEIAVMIARGELEVI